MEPYFRNIYPFLILRRLNIVPDPLSIFSLGNKTKLKFDDFEYIGGPKEKCVDGYEINIFEESDKDIFHQIDKKYLLSYTHHAAANNSAISSLWPSHVAYFPFSLLRSSLPHRVSGPAQNR